jgi:hypothetical protein
VLLDPEHVQVQLELPLQEPIRGILETGKLGEDLLFVWLEWLSLQEARDPASEPVLRIFVNPGRLRGTGDLDQDQGREPGE